MPGSSGKRDHSQKAAASSGCSVGRPGDLMTVAETARLLRLSRRSIERLLARGALPFYELPLARGGLRFSRTEIAAFLESRHRDVV